MSEIPVANPGTPRYSQEEVAKSWAENSGKMLDDSQIVDLILNTKPDEIDSVVLWLGGGLAASQRPRHRFSQIFAESYDSLPDSEKAEFISRASRFALTDFQQTHHFPTKSRFRTVESLRGGGDAYVSDVRNVGELMARALEFTNGDLQKARRLLTENLSEEKKWKNAKTNLVLLSFLVPKNGDVATRAFLTRNPQIAELAFWIDVDMGDLNPGKGNFIHLIDSVFPNATWGVRTQILAFITELAASGKITDKVVGDVSLLMSKIQKEYMAQDTEKPDSFVEAFGSAKSALVLADLFRKVKGKTINIEEVVVFLENNPQLNLLVTDEELQTALDQTAEHGLALRIEKLIKQRKVPKQEA